MLIASRSLRSIIVLCAVAGLVLATFHVAPTQAADHNPPRNVAAVASASTSAAIEVSWNSPTGSTPIGYRVEIQRLTAEGEWSPTDISRQVTTAGTVVIDGLVNGASYRASVQAVYSGGLSDAVVSSAAVPYGRPGAPTIISAVPGNSQVALSWTAAAPNGRPVTAYTISVEPADVDPVSVGGSTTSAVVTGLQNDTTYLLRVRATNLRGDGNLSASFTAQPTAGSSENGGGENGGGENGGGENGGGNEGDPVVGEPPSDGDPEGPQEPGVDDADDGLGPDEPVDQGDDTTSDSDTPQAPGDEGTQPPGDDPAQDGTDGSEQQPVPGPGGFLDVSAGSTHADSIATLVEAGITEGCAPDRFCPTDPVTRQQMATFLVRALQLPPADEQPFIDVVEGSTHDLSIRSLAASGITRGCTDDQFCPGDPVLRGQMASFLARGLELAPPQDPVTFLDVPGDHPHRESIEALYDAEVTRGCDDQRFCPDTPVTREQMASFLVRALDL